MVSNIAQTVRAAEEKTETNYSDSLSLGPVFIIGFKK